VVVDGANPALDSTEAMRDPTMVVPDATMAALTCTSP
jgi:hypothetical protein